MKKPKASRKDALASNMAYIARSVSPRMRTIHVCSFILACILAGLTLLAMHYAIQTQAKSNRITEAHHECQQAVDVLQETSDSLTYEARQYVETADPQHLNNYINEVEHSKHRESALQTLRENASNQKAVEALEQAREYSNSLSKTELRAMRLVAETQEGLSIPDSLQDITLSKDEQKLSNGEKRDLASKQVSDERYMRQKLDIKNQVQESSDLLIETLRDDLERCNAALDAQLTALRVGIILLLFVLAFVILSTTITMLWPMAVYEQNIRDDQALDPMGAQELRYLTAAYNDMYARNHDRAESLSYEANNDALTGVHNRGSFDKLLSQNKSSCALILVDIDYFKNFNDEWGHEMGDAILVEVAATLYASFKSTDHVCRIGGDEFAVIMADAHPNLRNVIAFRIEKVATFLRDTSNGLPAATVSVGIAFGELGCAEDELFKRADSALYEVKRRGRDGYAFYGET
ncbi:MAG: diguanylate cyclase [Coriobacteriales bacterium]|nr:diguanylate cyclase [Coriobacteriales bacterium]